MHLVVVILLQDLIHAHVEDAQGLDDSVGRLKDAVGGEQQRKDERDEDGAVVLQITEHEHLNFNHGLFGYNSHVEGVSPLAVDIVSILGSHVYE